MEWWYVSLRPQVVEYTCLNGKYRHDQQGMESEC